MFEFLKSDIECLFRRYHRELILNDFLKNSQSNVSAHLHQNVHLYQKQACLGNVSHCFLRINIHDGHLRLFLSQVLVLHLLILSSFESLETWQRSRRSININWRISKLTLSKPKKKKNFKNISLFDGWCIFLSTPFTR